jgi:hypothetical protein
MTATSTATPSESLALLGRAAELRASGTHWADAAAQLSLGHDELRRLVSDHSRDYERLVRRARTDVLRETLDEALAALRTHLTSRDERVSMVAATTLVRYDLARTRLGAQEARTRLERRARKLREQNASESTEVTKRQKVDAPKNVAQTAAPRPAASAPTAPHAPAPAKTPAAPATATATPPTPATASAAPPPAAKAPLDELARRRLRRLNEFALGRTPPAPLVRGSRQTLEVERLISGWLTE